MGTKLNPGKFDCYHNAEPDEELFVLLGRDPMAAHLVAIWSALRAGQIGQADHQYNRLKVAAWQFHNLPDREKAAEAALCADRMHKYRLKREKGG